MIHHSKFNYIFLCKMNFIILLVVCAIFNACNERKLSYQDDLHRVIGNKVNYPKELIQLNPKHHIREINATDTGFKIIVYVDSFSCTLCNMKTLLPWNNFYPIFNSMKIPVEIILYSDNVLDVQNISKELDFEFPYFYDVNDEFKQNNYIPKFEAFRSFLTKNDTIIAVGNPALNDKIFDFYVKIVQESSKDD